MDVTEKWGDDVESAIKLALIDLNLTIEDVDVEVLEQPSRGFFGIGSKLARVRVSKKNDTTKKESEKDVVLENEGNSSNSPSSDECNKKKTTEEVINEFFDEDQKNKANEIKEEKPKKNHNKKSNLKIKASDKEKYEDNYKNLEFLPICENHEAGIFLDNVISKMGLDVKINVKADDSRVYVSIEGKDSGTIIGKRGQTLDAIQYLTSLVVNKGKEDYIKVVVDAENYRSRREEVLEKLAIKLANKVISKGRPVRLEPMNPYERKVIHATLQDDDRIVTRSEGQDPYRRVIIELKK